jgi:endonuclease/exonuclease/phosphatase family metal-dependent hydrolase
MKTFGSANFSRYAISGILGSILAIFVTSASAGDFNPGDIVQLIEREPHIPAHPAPGSEDIHLRFISGSRATVLGTDSATGWVELNGEPLEGSETVGWVAARYIAESSSNGEAENGALSWCPPKSSPAAHTSGRLRIATWNIGNLHAEDGQSTYNGADPSVKRSAIDYERIRCYVRLFDPDILAVQEIDGEEALTRVVDMDVYDVHVSDRPKGSLNGMQNTGFAFKRGLQVSKLPDFEDLDVNGNATLRYGARIDLTQNGQTISLMSVHLKSGCFDNGSTSSACNSLMAQVPVLERWIDEMAESANAFIVLGDFNRRFNVLGDSVWMELDDASPANADLTVLTQDMPISCRGNEYTEFIDHIVLDQRAARWVDRSSFRHITFRQADRDAWDKISDHCPIAVELWINNSFDNAATWMRENG